jgi:hypothetical protein
MNVISALLSYPALYFLKAREADALSVQPMAAVDARPRYPNCAPYYTPQNRRAGADRKPEPGVGG